MPTKFWHAISFGDNHYISHHSELNVSITVQGDATLALIGTALHPLFPDFSNQEIVEKLIVVTNTIDDLIEASSPLSGRWLLIYNKGKEIYIFTDPIGFRALFYKNSTEQTIFGSQPEVINAVSSLRYSDNELLLEYLYFQNSWSNESDWAGDETMYKDCYRLMPNHFLKFPEIVVQRFFPKTKNNNKSENLIINEVVPLFQGFYRSLFLRESSVIQGLTGGLDSRLLLAASKEFQPKILYYVDDFGIKSANRNPDIWVSKKIADRFNLNFEIRKADATLPGWFFNYLSKNVTAARCLAKTRPTYQKLILNDKRININGNGSEICRDFPSSEKPLYYRYTPEELTYYLFWGNYKHRSAYIESKIASWLTQLSEMENNIDLLHLLYWEQRLGTWGANFLSEQDIAIDQLSPFNNRKIIETMLTSEEKLRQRPDYPLYLGVIDAMWPDLLKFPINPGKFPLIYRIKNKIKKTFFRD